MSTTKLAWVSVLEKQLEENPKCIVFALSTLSPENKPRVRHVNYRGLTPSNLILTSTDLRWSKPVHLNHSSTIEIAWWLRDTNTQFRITGQAFIIPPSAESEGWDKVIEGLHLTGKEEGKKDWWCKKKDELWSVLSGHLRASFGRPIPGRKLEEVDDSGEWPETIPAKSRQDDVKEQKLIEKAWSNFAIIAIRPEAVEFLELNPVPNRRTQWAWKKRSDGLEIGSWEEVKVTF
nr:hypothetical protein L204_04841 [Cryptococcus depauperatus CBS 7855]